MKHFAIAFFAVTLLVVGSQAGRLLEIYADADCETLIAVDWVQFTIHIEISHITLTLMFVISALDAQPLRTMMCTVKHRVAEVLSSTPSLTNMTLT